MPRQRRQVRRYGKQDETVRISDLETSDSEVEEDDQNSNSVASSSQRGTGVKQRKRRGHRDKETDDVPFSVHSEGYPRSDCYAVEKNLLVFGFVQLLI